MGFLIDWSRFPNMKNELLTLGAAIKEDASKVRDYQQMYYSDLTGMLEAVGKEFVRTNDDKIVSAIRSALLELSDAVIKNNNYAQILVDATNSIKGKTNAIKYVALCMLVFKNSSHLSKLNDVIKQLNLNIPIQDVINAQEDWYRGPEVEMLRAARGLKEIHNNN